LRAPPARTALASIAPRPLLIFPLAAERRPTPPGPGKLSESQV
jgi:hypothetical protein